MIQHPESTNITPFSTEIREVRKKDGVHLPGLQLQSTTNWLT